ncbi:hypothetical protein [Segnochrobactrum spirostomi]|uniref:Transmembrane protein n=1 Tax=Segnochrobactrum spirostomi TaxID=2608987 RepID=A0A6A7XZ04_9HYPH|nr:hypothetical protein [Segnochrobactrum spirostomi]MQT11924.1 hypothetical protein [Segnochrobactrum spirostomi]
MANTSVLPRLLAGLRKAPHDYRPSLQVFPDLEVERIAVELRLSERGAERGARDEPAMLQTQFDEVENRIVEKVQSEHKAAHGVLAEEMRAYTERLAVLDFEGRFALIRQAAPEAVSEFRAEAAQGRDELHRLRRQLKDLEDERADFRTRHKIRRTARPATGGGLTLKVGILLVLFVFEVVVNGVFLSKGSELGLVGGAVEALTFAMLNVGVSFAIAAAGVRCLLHRNWFMKLIGLASLVFYVAFAIGLNLALSHYREISGTFASDAGVEVVRRILADPLGLAEMKSWMFFAIGLLFSAIAFGDAFFIYDPYPGYGGIEKRLAAAHDVYIDAKADLIGRLREIRDDATEALEEADRDLSVRRAEYEAIVANRVRVVKLFAAHERQIERAANALLSTYREANVRARQAPAPTHFSHAVSLERIEIDVPQDTMREELRTQIAESQALLVRHVEAIHGEFEAAVATYRQIDDMIEGDGAKAEGRHGPALAAS